MEIRLLIFRIILIELNVLLLGVQLILFIKGKKYLDLANASDNEEFKTACNRKYILINKISKCINYDAFNLVIVYWLLLTSWEV